MIKEKLPLMLKYFTQEWRLKFYVYFNANDRISDLVCRCEFLKSYKILPYILRDINVYSMDEDIKNFLTDYVAYTNQPNFLKKMSFDQFLIKRHTNLDRIRTSLSIYKGD